MAFISAAEIAKRAGMEASAVNAWLRKYVKSGKIEVAGKERGKNVYDECNQIIQNYIALHVPVQQAIKKTGRKSYENPEASKETSDSDTIMAYELAYRKERAKRLEIQNAKARGELISREYVKRVIGEIYSIHRSIFLSGGPVISTNLAAKLGVKSDSDKMIINEAIDDHCYKTLSAVKRKINDFLTANAGEPIADDSLPDVQVPQPRPHPKIMIG